MQEKIKTYYSLTKPRVLYGNVITGIAGFLLASGYFRKFDPILFIATILGMTLIIASACVLNNYLDQDIDQLMERTKNRAMASGKIANINAIIFSVVLGILGISILSIWVNLLVVSIGVIGFITYVWLYGALSKRLSVHGTLVGSISGSAPILAGYVAVSNRLDTAAIVLFLILFFWQFPEFYSIAIYRKAEYAAAKIPVISVVKGVSNTIRQITIYTVLFVVSTLMLTILGYTGWIYFAVMLITGFIWLRLANQGSKTKNPNAWAHKMFHFSLITLLILCLMLSIGSILP